MESADLGALQKRERRPRRSRSLAVQRGIRALTTPPSPTLLARYPEPPTEVTLLYWGAVRCCGPWSHGAAETWARRWWTVARRFRALWARGGDVGPPHGGGDRLRAGGRPRVTPDGDTDPTSCAPGQVWPAGSAARHQHERVLEDLKPVARRRQPRVRRITKVKGGVVIDLADGRAPSHVPCPAFRTAKGGNMYSGSVFLLVVLGVLQSARRVAGPSLARGRVSSCQLGGPAVDRTTHVGGRHVSRPPR